MNKLIYYRTAKCASTALRKAINRSEHSSIYLKHGFPKKKEIKKINLNEYEIIMVGSACNPHQSYFLNIQAELDKLKNYKSFAICRDPYSKFISSINYCISKGKLKSNKLLSTFFLTQMDPNKLAQFSDHDKIHILRTQTDGLSINGHFFADEIIKYENLNTLPDFFKANGMNITLNKERVTKKKPIQISKQMIEFVNEAFSCDFENFGYEKKYSIDDFRE